MRVHTHTYRHAQGQCWDCTGDRIFSKLFCFTNFHLDRNMLKATPMCAHNPQVVKFQFSHLLLLASSADKVTTSKSKQRRGVTHTHTHQSTCMQATLISRPSIPHFFHIYFPASFALLWCIIEAVCNFTSSFLAESLLKLNFHFSCSCGIFSLKWRVELFEHAGQHTFPPARLTPSPLRIILTLSQKQKFTQHHLNLSFLVIKVNLFILSFYWKKSQLFTCFFHLTPYFNGLTLFFISKFWPEYPLMTKWKKIAWNSCKLIKN